MGACNATGKPRIYSEADPASLTGSASVLEKKEFTVIRLIFSSDFTKSAYINFLRHEDQLPGSSNYFRDVNFLKIGIKEDAVSDVLSDCGHQSDPQSNKSNLPYPSLESFFYEVSGDYKQEIYNYQGGSVREFLSALQKAHNYALLMMMIDSVERFQQSASYQRWIEKEADTSSSFESTLSTFFSKHLSSRRTQVILEADAQCLNNVLSTQDWLCVLKECVMQTPIATAICRYNFYGKSKHSCSVVYTNDTYTSMFKTTAADLHGKDINLIHSIDCGDRIDHIVATRSSSKLALKMKIRGSETMIAVSTIPVSDTKQQYWYMLFVCCNLSAPSFTMDELKIVSDFADVLPRSFLMRSPLSQEKTFPPPAIDATEEPKQEGERERFSLRQKPGSMRSFFSKTK